MRFSYPGQLCCCYSVQGAVAAMAAWKQSIQCSFSDYSSFQVQLFVSPDTWWDGEFPEPHHFGH